jgi:hypothetical protein
MFKRRILKFAVTVAAIMPALGLINLGTQAMAATAAPRADIPTPGHYYNVKNKESNYCMAVKGTKIGSYVLDAPCHSARQTQQWTLIQRQTLHGGSAWYHI